MLSISQRLLIRAGNNIKTCTSTDRSFVSASCSKRTRPRSVISHSIRLQPNLNDSRDSDDNSTEQLHLPMQFLEAYDDLNFDPSTHQRIDVPFDPIDGKPPLSSPAPVSQSLDITWELDDNKDSPRPTFNVDGLSNCSTYSKNWLRVQEERWRMDPTEFDCTWDEVQNIVAGDAAESNDTVKRILWSNWTEEMIRDPTSSPILFQYNKLRSEAESNTLCGGEEKRLLKALYQYGLVLVTGTPIHTNSIPEELKDPSLPKNTDDKESAESAILHLTSLIGYHPLQTLYGPGVWSTSSKSSFYNEESDGLSASTADSAYGSTSLPLHTDMTYMASPPGVQVFLMVQPATTPKSNHEKNSTTNSVIPTGQSVYLDGFAAARQLQLENPDAFHLLASTTRQYRCIDDQEGWHMEASGSVIQAVPRGNKAACSEKWGPVKSIRHNDLDRLPDLPPHPHNSKETTSDEFYEQLREAHEAFDNILRHDSMRLVIGLRPGDCVLVSNQRVMHGRYAFDASHYPRVVMGCYVGIDELLSKWRTNGFRVL